MAGVAGGVAVVVIIVLVVVVLLISRRRKFTGKLNRATTLRHPTLTMQMNPVHDGVYSTLDREHEPIPVITSYDTLHARVMPLSTYNTLQGSGPKVVTDRDYARANFPSPSPSTADSMNYAIPVEHTPNDVVYMSDSNKPQQSKTVTYESAASLYSIPFRQASTRNGVTNGPAPGYEYTTVALPGAADQPVYEPTATYECTAPGDDPSSSTDEPASVDEPPTSSYEAASTYERAGPSGYELPGTFEDADDEA